MKKVISWAQNASWFSLGVAVAGVLLAGTVAVQAATTISTNISTAGTVTATGDVNTVGDFNAGGTIAASSTAAIAGALSASSTAMIDGAFRTFGAVFLGDETGDSILINGNITGTSTVNFTGTGSSAVQIAGTASTSKLQVGGDNSVSIAGATTTVNGLATGFCTFASVTISATSTDTVLCTGANGVRSGDRVFVTATSSLPASMFINAASSSAANVVQLRIYYAGNLTNATLATGVNSVWYWATR